MDFSREDTHWMKQALALADKALQLGEVPVGALIVQRGEVIGEGFNHPIGLHDPTAHAEIMAIRAACQRVANYRLPDTTLYVTLEPCAMCAGAIVHARISRVIIAALEPKAGAIESTQQFFQQPQLNHRVDAQSGLLQPEASALLSSFFKHRRQQKKAAKRAAE
ncbi:MAG: tRNA adenosine(34) deaminase TadA [Gammaproteobacteria bacterium]|nr:MAG: tRNA adenosine(34) deaminase TadA [Gammaproteobacteria bacterium]